MWVARHSQVEGMLTGRLQHLSRGFMNDLLNKSRLVSRMRVSKLPQYSKYIPLNRILLVPAQGCKTRDPKVILLLSVREAKGRSFSWVFCSAIYTCPANCSSEVRFAMCQARSGKWGWVFARETIRTFYLCYSKSCNQEPWLVVLCFCFAAGHRVVLTDTPRLPKTCSCSDLILELVNPWLQLLEKWRYILFELDPLEL